MTELNGQVVECTLYATAFNVSDLALSTLDRYIGIVQSDSVKEKVLLLRAYLAAGEPDKFEAGKKQLPLCVAGGAMEGGRKLEHLIRYSQCCIADLDDVPGNVEEVVRKAETLPYVKAGHISPSGTGIKLFILVDSPLPRHREAFECVSRRIEQDLPGVTVDPSGKDANRGCFFSYDPTAFYKEWAEVLHVPVLQTASAHAPQPSGNALANYIDKFEQGNPFVGGNRHSFVVKLASALNSAGFDEREVCYECLRRYTEPGFTEKEIRGIVSDIYRRYRSSHGSNPWSPPLPPVAHPSVTSVTSVTPPSENYASEGESPLGFDIEPEEAGLPHFDRNVLEHLPGLVLDTVKTASDDREFDLMVLSALTILSTVMPGVSGMLKKEPSKTPIYTLIIGPSGSGKGCINIVYRIVKPWHAYVHNTSKAFVKEYLEKKEVFENYKLQQRASKGKAPEGIPPEDPTPVFQKRLHISGYTTTARMIEQLDINKPYASLLYETELDSVNNTIMQDFGGYSYVLNQAFHGEQVSSSSKTNGSACVESPEVGFLASGTPAMLPRLIPSTESGLYSRMLIYRIAGRTEYHPLTSSDDTMNSLRYFDNLGQRVLDMAIYLEHAPTFVRFSDKQRKRLDRYFEREYNNVRVFGNDDVASVVLRHRLIIFRLAMTLTGIRKGEARKRAEEVEQLEGKGTLPVEDIEITDEDFDIAFHIGTSCLRHSLVVSTSLKHSDTVQSHKLPDAQVELFDAMPDEFKTSDVVEEARVRGICRSSVFRMLRKAQEYELLIMLSVACYKKTEKGKNVKK
ncbi:DUF3987 domain-containing protein [Parabacteroides sp.]